MTALVIAAPAGASRGADDGALPDAGEVVAAYLALRTWTDGLNPPPLADPQARLPLTDASGACVTLRRFGRVIGTASAIHGRSDGDLLPRRALGRALAQALGDPAVAGLPEEMRNTIGPALTLELEVAGPLEPMLGRTYQRLARDLDPGLHGVAMRRGDQWAMLFPSQALASNTAGNMAARLPGLASELGLPAGDLSTLIQQHGVSVYRFRTLHLAQSEPRGFPFETIRGDVLVPDSAVTERGIAAFASGLAMHLLGKIYDADDADEAVIDLAAPSLGLLGDYHPVADTYRPLTAPPLDQALVAFALARYAGTPGVEPGAGRQAEQEVHHLLKELAARLDEGAQMDPAVAAAVVYAVAAYRATDVVDEAIAQLHANAIEVVAGVQITQVRQPHAQAMIAGAAARLLSLEQAQLIDVQDVREMLDAAWQAAPEHQHVALLPWIGWGELDYAAATSQPLARVEQLRQIREVLEASRVTSADEHAAPDLYGGFALADGVAARPTAQVTRPAVFMATMLREPALTEPDETSPNLGRHLQTIRFLMQLSVRDENAWSMRNPGRARGGIRGATWDSEMPNAAQAMALLAAVETLESLEHMRR